MFYAITKNELYTGKTLKDINKKLNAILDVNEFRRLGNNYIINLTDDDINFIQDTKKMSKIMVQNLFKKSDSTSWLIYIIIGLQLILLLKG
ncbi:MAG: hypothetical protein GX285_02330 [Clostridiales bacterium]|nr:hypothetical protein [Clostridiales bacterium]